MQRRFTSVELFVSLWYSVKCSAFNRRNYYTEIHGEETDTEIYKKGCHVVRVVEASKGVICSFAAAILIAALAAPLFAHQRAKHVLTGVVSSAATSEPLPGATIRVTGTTLGTTTNTDGRYRLLLPSGTYSLLVSFIGFNSSAQTVKVADQDTTLNIILAQSQVSLPEVVVYPHSANPADEIIARASRAK